jgi:hypothetical protein
LKDRVSVAMGSEIKPLVGLLRSTVVDDADRCQ